MTWNQPIVTIHTYYSSCIEFNTNSIINDAVNTNSIINDRANNNEYV